MPWITEGRRQTLLHIVLALLMGLGLWYMVVGSDQVDGQFEMRLEYRGLPDGLMVREGLAAKVTVRLRGSAALMRNLYTRDLSYAVDLSEVQRGANVVLLEPGNLPDFRAFEVAEVTPPRLLLEVDGISEAMLPLDVKLTALPGDSPLRLTYFLPDPAYVKVRGPESVVRQLKSLPLVFDPGMDAREGTRALSVAIAAPDQVSVTPPVTMLRYTLSLKTQEVEMTRVVQLDVPDRSRYEVTPRHVTLKVEVPEARVNDATYLAAIRVVVRPADDMVPGSAEEFAVLVILPEGARLTGLDPSLVRVAYRYLNPPGGEAAQEEEESGETEQPASDVERVPVQGEE